MPVIKWSGSKRSQSEHIVKLFPKFRKYYEPFLGGGSVLIRANPQIAIGGDICEPLIDFWETIRDSPKSLVTEYSIRWDDLQKNGYLTYYKIRDSFNENPNPFDLLFLSRTCVNGLIRFNNDGKFNNSLHHTRKGIHPSRIEKIIFQWSDLIKNYTFVKGDYVFTTNDATEEDFIYLDPPYFNTVGRYYGKIDHDKFLDFLEKLNKKNIKFALSFDGQRANKEYLVDLPDSLYERKFLLDSGNSSFKKVMDKKVEFVRESVYLNY